MAQAGAHLTSPAPADQRPSLFEVLAQESLMETLKPALRHAVKVLAESAPARFGGLWRRFDELYLLLDLLLQNHFLSRSSASFSENFYGLKRVTAGRGLPVGAAESGGPRRRSLLLLCVAPYLRAKLEAALERQREEEDFSIQAAGGGGGGRRLRRAAAAAYPYVSAAWRLLVLLQQLLFVFGLSGTHSPLLWMGGVRLRRLDAADLGPVEPRAGGRHAAGQGTVQRAWWMMSQAARGVASSLSSSLSLALFLLQFLDWFYSAENQSAVKTLTSLPAPPPPLHLREEEEGEGRGGGGRGSGNRACPLCRRPSVNATVLSTSGFVFCYRCVYVYVKTERRCPVTGFPSEPQHLIKIYSPET